MVGSWTARHRGIAAVLFGLGAFVVYLSNGRFERSSDVMPSTYLPLAIIRGHGLDLEPVAPAWLEGSYSVTNARGHLVSRYPVAPGLAAVPATALQVAIVDAIDPSWTTKESSSYPTFFAKNSHALLVALAAGLHLRLSLRLSTSRAVALMAAIAATYGSSLWSVASQGAWQHGLAALNLTIAMSLLIDERSSRARLLASGLAAAVMVASRPIDIVFAAVMAAWVVHRHRQAAGWFFVAPVFVGAALVTHNLYYFGALDGGQSQLELLHPTLHQVSGTWTGNILDGALGTLVSPSRGLLVYTPWVVFAVAGIGFSWRALPSIVRWLVLGLLINLLALSMYACWWGGWSFGPRFWTDSIPILAVVFVIALDRAAHHHRAFLALASGLVMAAIGIHALGAYGYPSTWNGAPVNVDRAHERLWDWRDNEITRILKEGLHEPAFWNRALQGLEPQER